LKKQTREGKRKSEQKKFYADVVRLNKKRAKENINHKDYTPWHKR
jgi:hypothetical protein